MKMLKQVLALMLAVLLVVQIPLATIAEEVESTDFYTAAQEEATEPSSLDPDTPIENEVSSADATVGSTDETASVPSDDAAHASGDQTSTTEPDSTSPTEPAGDRLVEGLDGDPEAWAEATWTVTEATETTESLEDASTIPTLADNTEPAETTPIESIPVETIPMESNPAETIPDETADEALSETIPEEFATEPTEEQNPNCGYIHGSKVYWELADGILIISGSGDCPTFGSASDQPWAAVRGAIISAFFTDIYQLHISNLAYWFDGCYNLVSVNIPSTTYCIGSRAFAGCTSLSQLANSYEDLSKVTIAADAFAGCPINLSISADEDIEDAAEQDSTPQADLSSTPAAYGSNLIMPLAGGCQPGGHPFDIKSQIYPTCTLGGRIDYFCPFCFATSQVYTSPLGHSSTYEDQHDATCTEDGWIDNRCSRCNEALSSTTLPALGHSSTYKDRHNATCTEDGWIDNRCSRCNEALSSTTLPALGHGSTYKDRHNATCTEDGWIDNRCSRCNVTLSSTTLPALGHGSTYKDRHNATCTEDGWINNRCSRCNVILSPTILPALGHSSTYAGRHDATCTENGWINNRCSRCNVTLSPTILPALGHSSTYGTRQDATCTENGWINNFCSRCNVTLSPTILPALGHSSTYQDRHDAACTEDGWINNRCSRCNVALSSTTLPALGHSWGDYTYASSSPSAHTASRTCSTCHAVDAADQAHTYPSGSYTCQLCGHLQFPNPGDITLNITGHGNALNSGTGYVALSWNALPDTSHYFVCIFNGKEYVYLNVGNTTSWTSRGKGLWPTEAEVASGSYAIHTDGGGAELSALPCLAYANADSAHGGDLNYYFAVIPANQSGYSNLILESYVKNVVLPDTVAPSAPVSVKVDPADYTNANQVSVQWSGIQDYNGSTPSTSMGTGCVQYAIDDPSLWLDTGLSEGTASCPIDVSALEDGTHIVYIRGMDSAGNTGSYGSAQLYIDHTAPAAPQAALDQTTWSRDPSITLSWSGLEDISGLNRVEYAFDQGDFTSTGIAEEVYTALNLDISTLADGEHTLQLRAVDRVGNVGEATALPFYKDTTSPAADSLTVTPDSWTNLEALEVSWSGLRDTHSGIKQVWYQLDGSKGVLLALAADAVQAADISALADGTHSISVYVEDFAGNILEQTFPIYVDRTEAECSITSPLDGAMVGGSVEVYASVDDLSLSRWELTLNGQSLAQGDQSFLSAPICSFNCKAFKDGEVLTLTLSAWDQAGNTASETIILTVSKRAIALPGTLAITAPTMGQTLTLPSIQGETTAADGTLLYIDGAYAGTVTGGTFPFDPVLYTEGSSHTISLIDPAGGPAFSQGLAEYIALSDSFTENSPLAFLSELAAPARPVLALRFESVGSASIRYSYTPDGGSTWHPIASGDFIPLSCIPSGIQIRAEGAKDSLSGFTLYGVMELSPLSVRVELFRPIAQIETLNRVLTCAYTDLAAIPEGAETLYQFVDADRIGDSFTFFAPGYSEGSEHTAALLALMEDGTLAASRSEAQILKRETFSDAASAESGPLCASAPIYALRLEALDDGNTVYSYSTDNAVWHPLSVSEYVIVEKSAPTVFVRAKGGSLRAWHIEGVTCEDTELSIELVAEPTDVRGTDYGAYYENEALRRYDLYWTDPTPEDPSAASTLLYEIYRNGELLDTVDQCRYTDRSYYYGAQYAIRTLRRYAAGQVESDQVTARLTRLAAPVRNTGVVRVPQEQKQSEYLNALYGGNYTLSTQPNAPHDKLYLAVMGEIDLCAYGLEPVNLSSGNFTLSTQDYTIQDRGLAELTVTRSYNSQSPSKDGPFGSGWESALTAHLTLYINGDAVYHAPGGAYVTFRKTESGYTGGEAHSLTLTVEGSEFLIQDLNGSTWVFTSGGLLKCRRWRDGSQLQFLRSEQGLLSGIVLPSGKTLQITSDSRGHITKLVTPGGSMLQYAYTGSRLTAFTDALGGVTRYEYDGLGRMTKWYDASGVCQVKNTYDAQSRVIRQEDALGGVSTIQYFDDHNVITDAQGGVSTVWIDENFYTTKTQNPDGSVVTYGYDGSKIIAKTDASGLTTLYKYDSSGNKTLEAFPDGSAVSMAYNQRNQLTRLTDQLGAVTTYDYDASGNQIRQSNPDGSILTWEYDEWNRLIRATDALGGVTAYAYTEANLTSVTDPLGNVTQYAYDEENRPISVTDALGNTTLLTYDAAGNLICQTFPDGTSMLWEYDALGQLIRQTDPEGNVTLFAYDAMGNLLSTTYADNTQRENSYDLSGNLLSAADALGNTALYSYSPAGQLLESVDAAGNATRYEYDAAGRLVAEILPTGARREYNYSPDTGFLTGITNEAGLTTTFAYDLAGRLTRRIAPNGAVTEYSYDSMGYLIQEVAPNGAVTRFAYDLGGNLLRMVDALGGETRYEYDLAGNLRSVTDALGGVTRYEYDALNRPVAIMDPNGNVTRYQFDSTGSLVSVTDPMGNVERYTYDRNGTMTAVTDPLGATVSLQLNAMGQPVSVTGKNGAAAYSEFDPAGRVLSQTDALGNVTRYEYDPLGNVVKITDALDNVTEKTYNSLNLLIRDGETRYDYDDAGRQIAVTDAAGLRTEYVYDSSGNLATVVTNGSPASYEYDLSGNIVKVTDTEGRSISFAYDLLGNITSLTYPDGTKDRYRYDALGRLVRVQPAHGVEKTYSYDPAGNLLSVTEGKRTTRYTYDALNRPVSVTYPDGSTLLAEYDALGNLISQTDALGNVTRYTYDAESMLTAVTYADGTKRSLTRDLLGSITSETDELGSVTRYAYDALRRLTAVTDALGGQTAYEYDSQGNVTKVTDANGNATRYTYDPAGRLASETDALGNTLRYSYTPEGWLDTVTNPDGTVIRYAYDRTGNLISEDRGGTEKVQHSYNLLGQLTTVTNAQGSTRYQYNDRGWLIFVTAPDGSRVEYRYDDLGRQTKLIYPDGKSVSYAYDDMDRLVSVKGLDGSTTEYTYDANGRRIATKGAQAETAYTYDSLGQLVTQTTTGAANLAFAYRYDAAGRIIGETRTENGTATESAYAYDPLGQLTAFTRSTGCAERYSYDPAGNMTEKLVNGQKVTMTYNPANQLTEMSSDKGSIRYAYDPNGNLTQKQSALGTDIYTYDALGHLSSYTGYDGYTQSYTYNAFDLLSEKTSSGNANRLTQEEYVSGRTLTDPAEQLQDATTRYTWDITRSFGVLLSETTGNITTDYDYGFERISALSGNTKTEYLYDPRGSVAAELRYETANSTPNRIEVNFRSYSPFGEQLGCKASGFGYNGEAYDASTGALYLRARYYEPALNRFSQKDIDRGTVTNPKSLNRYLYTWNDPIRFIDPDGQRVTQWADVGGGTSFKKVPASKPSVPKPVTKCAPVAFQEQPVSTPVAFQKQPVSTSAAKVQTNIASTAIGAVTAARNVPSAVSNTTAKAPISLMAGASIVANEQAGRHKDIMTGAIVGATVAVGHLAIAASCRNKDGSPSNISEQTGLGEKIWNGIKDVSVWAYNGAKELVTSLFGAESTISEDYPNLSRFLPNYLLPLSFQHHTEKKKILDQHGDSSKPFSVYSEESIGNWLSSSMGAKINIASYALQLNLAFDDIQLSFQNTQDDITDSFGIKINLSTFSIGIETSTSWIDDNIVTTSYNNSDINGPGLVAILVSVLTGNPLLSPVYD